MDKKKQNTIIIAVVLIVAALGVAYFLDFSKWKEIKDVDNQITQTKALIESKKSYYSVIDSKMAALTDAGWASKKESIAVNFTSTPFFVPKINTFFQTVVLSSGMSLGSITSSTGASTKDQSTAQESGTKSTKSTTETTTTTTTSESSGYLGQLKGSIKKTTVNLSVSGTYSAFKNLLSIFENQTRIITIKSISVASGGQETATKGGTARNNLTFSMVLDIYSY